MEHGLIVAGFGGQGVVLAGKLVASAALMENREVVWAPSYGPEMRGGEVHCTVVVSDRRIGSPEVSLADSLVLMDKTSLTRFGRRLKPGGLLLVNRSLVSDELDGSAYELLAVRATEEAGSLGDQRVANVLLLGAYLTRRPVVTLDSLTEAMRQTAQGNQKLLDVNLRALDRGVALAQP